MMKKLKDYIILFFLALSFIMIFKYSSLVKASVLSSADLWLKNLVTSMLPLYFIIDLAINYGLLDLLFRIFKRNSVLLFMISVLLGTPSNAKYIKEFLKDGFIDRETGNFLLMFSYSPNPLFILGIVPSLSCGLKILGYLYLTIFVIFILFKKHFKSSIDIAKTFPKVSFIECIDNSIIKSFNILILILGVIVIYGLLNAFLHTLGVNSIFLSAILELTNALNSINENGADVLWMIFAVSFGGLSIHTQIKSILEDTELSYRYFLLGRLIASLPILIFIAFD